MKQISLPLCLFFLFIFWSRKKARLNFFSKLFYSLRKTKSSKSFTWKLDKKYFLAFKTSKYNYHYNSVATIKLFTKTNNSSLVAKNTGSIKRDISSVAAKGLMESVWMVLTLLKVRSFDSIPIPVIIGPPCSGKINAIKLAMSIIRVSNSLIRKCCFFFFEIDLIFKNLYGVLIFQAFRDLLGERFK